MAVVYNSSLRHGYCNHNASSVAVHGVNHPEWIPERPWERGDGADKTLVQKFPQPQSLPHDEAEGKKQPAAFQVRTHHASPITSHGPTQGAWRQPGSRYRKLIIICMFVKARIGELQYVTEKRACSKNPSLSTTP